MHHNNPENSSQDLHTTSAFISTHNANNSNQLNADKYELDRNQLMLQQQQKHQQQQYHMHSTMTYDLINGINTHLNIDASNHTSTNNQSLANNNGNVNGGLLATDSLLACKLARIQQQNNLASIQHFRSNSNSSAMDIASAPSSVVNNGLVNYVNTNNATAGANNINGNNAKLFNGNGTQLKPNLTNFTNLANATNFNGNNNGLFAITDILNAWPKV